MHKAVPDGDAWRSAKRTLASLLGDWASMSWSSTEGLSCCCVASAMTLLVSMERCFLGECVAEDQDATLRMAELLSSACSGGDMPRLLGWCCSLWRCSLKLRERSGDWDPRMGRSEKANPPRSLPERELRPSVPDASDWYPRVSPKDALEFSLGVGAAVEASSKLDSDMALPALLFQLDRRDRPEPGTRYLSISLFLLSKASVLTSLLGGLAVAVT